MLCGACVFLFLLSGELIIPNNGQPMDLGLDNLGAQITADVQRSLAPLRNLGYEIQQQVRGSLHKPINDNIQNVKWNPIDIDPSWSGPDLSNLGDQISKQVEEGMKPVYEMEVRLDMENGRGGITVVTFRPDGKTLIIKNAKLFECPGLISNKGRCSEDLKLFKIKNETDKCFLSSRMAVVNGQICLSTDSSLSVIGNSEGLTCVNGKGENIEPLSLENYKELCKNSAKEADYRYVTNNKISQHKPDDIRCSGSRPTVCKFSSKRKLPGGEGYISNVNINF